MKFLIFIAAFVLAFSSCNRPQPAAHDEHDHEHEEPKFQYTAYSENFEIFAEADPFVVGETANVLSHFSMLPNFKALESGKMTVVLSVNGKECRQILEAPTRKGIYSFDIAPETSGKGKLVFELETDSGKFQVIVPEVDVFAEHEQAHEAAGQIVTPKTNTIVFTKEQSWKVDFATGLPKVEPFGQVIKTTAQVQPAQGDEMVVSAKTNGIVNLSGNSILAGQKVSRGQTLLTISGGGMADNNVAVRYAEAQNNYEKAKADFERMQELAKDKIVSEKDLLNAKNLFQNAKAVYDNLNSNFSSSGQKISSPLTGYVRQLFVQNGQYVEAGHPMVSIAQNKNLLLVAEVQQKYGPALRNIQSAVFRKGETGDTFLLEELKGKILSVGQNTGPGNFLIPVNLQVENNGIFIPGEFVEVYLKTISSEKATTLPNSALLEEQGMFFVMVQVTPELFEKREVKTGATDGMKTEIISGIRKNERVVTQGAILVKLAQASGGLDPHAGHVH
jgi:RND family efflux transporter MFP subunit